MELFAGRRVANPRRWYLVCRKDKQNLQKLVIFREWLRLEIGEDAGLAGPQLERAARPAG